MSKIYYFAVPALRSPESFPWVRSWAWLKRRDPRAIRAERQRRPASWTRLRPHDGRLGPWHDGLRRHGTRHDVAGRHGALDDGPRRLWPRMCAAMAGHVEGRLAYLKAELKITDAQEPLWKAYAAVGTRSRERNGRPLHDDDEPEGAAGSPAGSPGPAPAVHGCPARIPCGQ